MEDKGVMYMLKLASSLEADQAKGILQPGEGCTPKDLQAPNPNTSHMQPIGKYNTHGP